MAILRKGKIRKQYTDVVFLDFISKYPSTEDSSCPAFLKDELQIGNFRGYTRRLVRAGYLQECDKSYALTEKGQKLLEENTDYLEFFVQATSYLTIWDYVSQKGKRSASEFPAIMAELFEKKLSSAAVLADTDAIKDIHLDLGDMYERQHMTEKALLHYMTVLYYDVSGMEYADILHKYIDRKMSKEKARKSFDGVYFRPDVLGGIGRTGEAYAPELVDKLYAAYPVEYHLCRKEKFAELMENIIAREALRASENAEEHAAAAKDKKEDSAAKQEAMDEKAWQDYFTKAFSAKLMQLQKLRMQGAKK